MSGDFPTAAQARATVERNAQAQAETQIMEVRNKISHAIQNGKTEVTCYAMKPVTQSYLEGMGYTVKRFDSGHQLDGPEWTVSW